MGRKWHKSVMLGELCDTCGDTLTLLNARFIRHRLANTCKKCHANRVSLTRNRELSILNRYKISKIDYDRIKASQNEKCAICKKDSNLVIDHDHDTGIVRGLLCKDCNLALGHFKEDEDIFWNALEYLKKHKWLKAG